jgi:glutathionylspermidine amidase/synthetase
MKFGEPIGITKQNVIAFSNDEIPNDSNDENKRERERESNYYKNIYTGLKYECVEFVRRWLIIVHKITFESVDHARNIYKLNNFYSITDPVKTDPVKTDPVKTDPVKKINIIKCANGESDISFGDLIIWEYQGEFSSYGHVAVVVGIKNNFVYIAEQNITNKSWNGKKYSRKLSFTNNTLVDIDYPDTKIVGWITYQKN